jgi:hypothetical protein
VQLLLLQHASVTSSVTIPQRCRVSRLLAGSTHILRFAAGASLILLSTGQRVDRQKLSQARGFACHSDGAVALFAQQAGQATPTDREVSKISESFRRICDRLAMKVVVFGSGSFGTAMATAVARNGHEVVVLSRSEEISAGINEQHRNLKYLSEFELLPNISSTCNPADALCGCDFIIHSVPVRTPARNLHTVPYFWRCCA